MNELKSNQGPATPRTAALQYALELRQQVEDTIMVAQKDVDADDFITAYHFKTGAIHRLLAKARDPIPGAALHDEERPQTMEVTREVVKEAFGENRPQVLDRAGEQGAEPGARTGPNRLVDAARDRSPDQVLEGSGRGLPEKVLDERPAGLAGRLRLLETALREIERRASVGPPSPPGRKTPRDQWYDLLVWVGLHARAALASFPVSGDEERSAPPQTEEK